LGFNSTLSFLFVPIDIFLLEANTDVRVHLIAKENWSIIRKLVPYHKEIDNVGLTIMNWVRLIFYKMPNLSCVFIISIEDQHTNFDPNVECHESVDYGRKITSDDSFVKGAVLFEI
jgi:hypothetical protein